MNIKSVIKYNPACLFLLLVLLQLVWQAHVQASTVNVLAEFTPSRNNPNNKTFTNVTPLSGVCSNTHAAACKARGLFSINTRIQGDKTGAGIPDGFGRDLYFGMPAAQTVTVISDTGETATVVLRITGVAFRYNSVSDTPARSDLSSVRGCHQEFSNANSGTSIMRIILRDDEGVGGAGSCVYPMLAAEDYRVAVFDIIYAIDTPEPLNMKNGVYRGSYSYSVGGLGTDLDLGDNVTVSDSALNVNFTLTVNHVFAIDMPPGSEKVNLQPLGGWRQWIDYKKVPETLRKDLHFQISGSNSFAVKLDCEYMLRDGRCGISNGASTVPLDIAITMPGFFGRSDAFLKEALNYPLLPVLIDIPRFHPRDGAVFQRRSYLRFEVNGEPIKEMVTHPGTQYKGRVTVIFDADM